MRLRWRSRFKRLAHVACHERLLRIAGRERQQAALNRNPFIRRGDNVAHRLVNHAIAAKDNEFFVRVLHGFWLAVQVIGVRKWRNRALNLPHFAASCL